MSKLGFIVIQKSIIFKNMSTTNGLPLMAGYLVKSPPGLNG
jgi:hypothetical protein